MGGVGSGWDNAGAAAANIDDDLKPRAYEPEKLGVTPFELMRQAVHYVAERGQLPFKPY
jgi:antitoxin component of RelBE/YafQ-DinJ toxin-antitoxin module